MPFGGRSRAVVAGEGLSISGNGRRMSKTLRANADALWPDERHSPRAWCREAPARPRAQALPLADPSS